MNENDLAQKFNKVSEKLVASNESQLRVKNLVFSRDYIAEQKPNLIYLLIISFMNILKSKLFWATGIFGMLVVFISVPLLFLQLGSINLDENSAQGVPAPMLLKEEAGDGTSYSNSKIMVGGDSSDSDIYIQPPVERNTFEDTETPQNERAQKREGSINITVDEFNHKYVELTGKISLVGGYILDSNTNSYDSYSSASVIARIPVDKFDEFMNFVRALALEVTSENISISDKQNELTETTKSIETTEAKIKELEDKLFRTTAEEQELKNLKSSLDWKKTDLQNLKSETEFSTVSIFMSSQVEEKEDDWKVGNTWERVSDTLVKIIRFWVDAGLWSLVPLLFCLPGLLVILLLVKFAKRTKSVKNTTFVEPKEVDQK